MTNLVKAASSYLSAGLHIIALTGKSPNSFFHQTWSYENSLQGVPETPEDDALIEKLFTHPTTSGIGIALPEYIGVVDIDGEEGAQTLAEIMGPDWVPGDTAVAKTGRGLHLYYITLKVRRSTTLGTKLDWKSIGGYVAAPPSRHPSGGIYEWIDPLIDEDSGQRVVLDWLPDKLGALLDATASVLDPDAEHEPAMTIKFEGERWKITYDWPRLEKVIAQAPDGNQNNLINWTAMVARDEGQKFEQAMEHLYSAAIAAGHPPQRARKAIQSAYKRR